MREAEELDERDEDDEDNSVPVENESYVNLKKRMNKKHHLKIDNLIQENRKLCREFQKKEVTDMIEEEQLFIPTDDLTLPSLQHSVFTVLPFSSSHPGASGPCWTRGRSCQLGMKRKTS